MRNSEGQPQGRQRFGFRTGERRTPTRSRGTPIDTYPPAVIPVVTDRVIAPERPAPTPILPPPDRVQPPPEQAPQKPKKHTGRNIALAGTALGVLGAGAYETYQNIPAVHRAVDSAFLDHIRGKATESSVLEIFDTKAREGTITEKNTVQITREEYAKIAPPTIDRTNVKTVPVEFKIPPGLDERTTRKLTLEQDTSVNALVYVKTPDGKVREVSYTKVTNPGKLTGVYPIPVVFPGCSIFLGQKGEIQAGDIFPAPISGRVYYHGPKAPEYYKGQKLENGTNVGGDYFIEGDYSDPKTGEKFKATVLIHTLEPINKPLLKNVPHLGDYIQGTSWMDAVKKMPIVTVEQGENLFQFLTRPPTQHFSSASPIQSQVEITSAYQGGIGENGIANAFGGENCVSPTLDNKAIVLK